MKERLFGFRTYRLNDLPYGRKELKLSEEFHKMSWQDVDRISLGSNNGIDADGTLSDREHNIVATVIQWLGTPCGEEFLSDCGFQHKEAIDQTKGYETRKLKKMTILQFLKWRKS